MYRFKQLLLLAGDAAALYGGLYLAVVIRELWRMPRLPGRQFFDLIVPMSALFGAAVVVMFIVGLYDIGQAKNTLRFYKKIIISALIWMVLGIVYFYLNPGLRVAPKTILLLNALAGFGLVGIWRYLHNTFLSSALWKSRLIFVHPNPAAEELMALFAREPQQGYEVAGVVGFLSGAAASLGLPQAPTWEDLQRAVNPLTVNLIIINEKKALEAGLLQSLYHSLFKQVEIITLAEFYAAITGRIPPFTFSEGWFLTNLREQRGRMYDRLRTIIDYLFALVLSVIFLATFPFIALGILLTSRGPIFFRQARVGRLGKIFTMYKYRTMQALDAEGSAEIEGPQFAAEGDRRITAIGRLLRRTRLDELPQFINILRAEMSIIGPRPERPEFVAQLTAAMPFYTLRHLVKPGLTGWAQLHRSYYGTIDENLRKLEYDLYYIKNRNPLLDAVILLRTVSIVARMIGR